MGPITRRRHASITLLVAVMLSTSRLAVIARIR
jgi:hypothetical protein